MYSPVSLPHLLRQARRLVGGGGQGLSIHPIGGQGVGQRPLHLLQARLQCNKRRGQGKVVSRPFELPQDGMAMHSLRER